MTNAKGQEGWRVFVNLYFRNYRVLHLIFSDREALGKMMDRIRQNADIDSNSDFEAKMKEIESFQFDPNRPLYFIKRPFDE